MKIAYFDCFSGISGDMILGALVDIGVAPKIITAELAKLQLDAEFSLSFEKATKHTITGTRAVVNTHDAQTSHPDGHHHEHGANRHLADILKLFDESELNPDIRDTAKRVFERLAEAEAKVHNTTKANVHLHEVSGIDSIVDIVGAVIGFAHLNVDEVYASPLALGRGFVQCAHGLMPIPAPGTMELLKGVPIHQTDVPKELVTPTGAALVTTLANGFGVMPQMTLTQVGYGAGARDLEQRPNLLRLCLGEKKKD